MIITEWNAKRHRIDGHPLQNPVLSRPNRLYNLRQTNCTENLENFHSPFRNVAQEQHCNYQDFTLRRERAASNWMRGAPSVGRSAYKRTSSGPYYSDTTGSGPAAADIVSRQRREAGSARMAISLFNALTCIRAIFRRYRVPHHLHAPTSLSLTRQTIEGRAEIVG